jgi:flagellar biosynthesis protein FlhF
MHTFRAASTEEAIEQVQKELGPEAMIVSVRQIPGGPAWQTWKRPEVEVVAMAGQNAAQPAVAGADSGPAIAPLVSPQPPEQDASRAGANEARSNERVEMLLNQLVERLERVHREKTRPAPEMAAGAAEQPAAEAASKKPAHPLQLPSEFGNPTQSARAPQQPVEHTPARPRFLSKTLQAFQGHLTGQGIEPDLVEKVIAVCAESLSPAALDDENRVRRNLRSQLEACLCSQASQAGRVVCLVGMSGAGKTSACAKLAAQAIRDRRQVVWVSADTVRTGAIALARAYTELLGIPLRLAYTPAELAETIAAEKEASLIIVDMPARNPRREAEVVELGAFLTVLPERNTYLVAPATAKEVDLIEALVAFSPFNLKGLVITKLDETDFYGDIFNLARRSGLPLVHFTRGPRVLEDLIPAQAAKLAGLVVGERLA